MQEHHFVYALVAVILVAVIAMNLFNQKRRAKMSGQQRSAEDEDFTAHRNEW